MSTAQSHHSIQQNNYASNASNGIPSLEEIPSFSGMDQINLSNITPDDSLDPPQPNPSTETIVDFPIPSYTAWFSLGSVHEIEKKAFPEFFSMTECESQASMTNSYSQARNFIIQTWRSSGSPPIYTSITAVRRHLAMDVASILKIHSFLERWGLINWNPESSQRAISSSTASFAAKPPATISPTLGSAPASNQELKTPVIWDTSSTNTTHVAPSANNDTHSDLKSTIHCNSCGMNIFNNELYHCLKDPSINLCARCFFDGRFSSSFFSGDFVKISSACEDDSSAWTDQELLYLLEGIEMFSSDTSSASADIWERISTHVQTRTSAECINKFIKLPTFTPSIDNDAFSLYNPILNSSKNPLASLIATLASAVHPDVGARAASLALSMLKPDLSNLDEIVSTITAKLPTFAASQLEEEENKTRKSLSLLVELLARKVDIKLSILESLETSLNSELEHLKTFSSLETNINTHHINATSIEQLH